MKNVFLFASLSMLFSILGLAQESKVDDNLTVPSKILKSERKYAVYLPPGYETSQRSYPILYLLHGATDNHTGWVQFGEVQRIADKAIQDGTATAMVIVMPDADTGRMGYFNSIGGDWNYEDFFFQEFMPTIEKTYRIKAEKRYRAVAGLSMGGGGSFMYALHHPELFSSACPLSAYIGSLNIDEMKSRIKKSDPSITDKAQIKAYFEKHNALDLAVGVIIGSAFGKIVSSFVADVLMPPIGALLGGTDFTGLKIILKDKVMEADKVVAQAVTINYGNFVQVTIDFLIIAFSIFMMIKLMNSMNKKEVSNPTTPPVPSNEEKLLTEIRDLLKRQ